MKIALYFLEVKKVTDSKSFYNIFSKDGILKTYYSDEDLVDLIVRKIHFNTILD
jgi:hypothetical protein